MYGPAGPKEPKHAEKKRWQKAGLVSVLMVCQDRQVSVEAAALRRESKLTKDIVLPEHPTLHRDGLQSLTEEDWEEWEDWDGECKVDKERLQ